MIKPNSPTYDPLAVPSHVYPYTAGVIGGVLGGIAMTIPAIIYGLVSGYGVWYPINLVAATVLLNLQQLTPQQIAQFDPLALFVGLVIHLIISTSLGLTFAVLLPTLPGRPEIWAVIVGPFLWFTATSLVLPQVNPMMSQLLDWTSFSVANFAYGLVMGLWVGRTPKVPAHEAYYLRFYIPKF